MIGANNPDTVTQWVTLIYQSVVYANWVDYMLKEDLKKFELTGSQRGEIYLDSDLNSQETEEIEILDEPALEKSPFKDEPSSGNHLGSTDTSSERISLKSSKDGEMRACRMTQRAVTDFTMSVEEGGGQASPVLKKDDLGQSIMTIARDLDFKFDEKVNFQSFEILKQLGAGAFGKVYKVRS